MATFWDTSGILPLLYREEHSPVAKQASAREGPHIGWEWLQVEARLAIARRGETTEVVNRLNGCLKTIYWQRVEWDKLDEVIQVGLRHRLRSADAGHLLALLQIRRLFPDIMFVCFDNELVAAAGREGIPIWERGKASTQ